MRTKTIEEIQAELKRWEKAAVKRAKGMNADDAPGILRVIFHSINERLEDMKGEGK